MSVLLPAKPADRTSGCVVFMAVLVCGVVVFAVALPLALSSPFPTPKQGEWILQTSPFDVASPNPAPPIPASPVVAPPMEPLAAEQPLLPASAVVDAQALPEPEPMTFTARWDLTRPVPNTAPRIEVPAQAARLAPAGRAVEAAPPKRQDAGIMETVDRYLWEVYQRLSVKSDSSGDFTWKDPAAAKRRGMSVQDYVIGGMDPDFREQLYHAGHAMDAGGIRWSMLSAFRDDYRQALASGFKAHGGNSQHGGSNATGGYGHGRAVDITTAEGEPAVAWHWIDAHGATFGLRRPMPGADPAHVQPRNTYHDLAQQLREARVRLANEMSGAGPEPAAGRTKVAARTGRTN